ncbi:MAG: hypothetical protein J7J21_04330 [Methanomicrobia archaeon]|nr:hypothetical protein [Methanomicrobia archaeon]
MNTLKRIIDGTVDDNIYKRIGWMYVSFLLIYISVTILAYLLLPDGILRSKHTVVSALELSPNLWISTLQIFGYNLIPTSLIICSNLIAQQSRISKEKFVPIGYFGFWCIVILAGLYLGTWSFEVVTEAPPLYLRLIRGFDVFHHAGFYELSAYLLAAVTSFKFTLWYSDGKKIVTSRKWRDVRLNSSEKIIFVLVFVLLFCGSLIESYGITQLAG